MILLIFRQLSEVLLRTHHELAVDRKEKAFGAKNYAKYSKKPKKLFCGEVVSFCRCGKKNRVVDVSSTKFT
jgi:hypothetical protein